MKKEKRPLLSVVEKNNVTVVKRGDGQQPSFSGACRAAGIDPDTVIGGPETEAEKLVENRKIYEETGKYPL